MKKNAATSLHASGFENGSLSGRESRRTWAGPARVSQSQTAASPVETTPKSKSGVRQPLPRFASGTAVAAAIAAPRVTPVV